MAVTALTARASGLNQKSASGRRRGWMLMTNQSEMIMKIILINYPLSDFPQEGGSIGLYCHLIVNNNLQQNQ
jgi:hypothetical protein